MKTVNKSDAADERALYKEMCLGRLTLEETVAQGRIGEQRAKELKWIVEPLCRGCKNPVSEDDFAIWNTYWNAMWAPCHIGCRDAGMKEEAYDCQSLDADCNDCKHFKRGGRILVAGAFYGSFRGHCLKFDKPTTAHVNFSTGHACFEHRRASANLDGGQP